MQDLSLLLASAAAAERAGHWQAALDLYARLYRQGPGERDGCAVLQAVLLAGNCYLQLGEAELAHEHLELALLLAEGRGAPAQAARALNGLAALRQQEGEPDAAEALYLRAHAAATAAGEAVLLAGIEQNLGTLIGQRGDLAASVERFHASLALFEAQGHARGCTWALHNLGTALRGLGRLDEADACFQQALTACEPLADAVTASYVHLGRAELLLAAGRPEHARQACDRAFDLCCSDASELHAAEALRVYGMIGRALGDPAAAEAQLRRAVEIAARRRAVLLEAEAQRDLAALLRGQGRNREAMGAFNRAHLLFYRAQAGQQEAEISRRIAQLEAEFLGLVERWGESIEAKDRYTGGHCRRVAGYAFRLAQSRLEPWELVWFRMGAFLHDIGKTGVPDAILNKPGALTAEERAAMQQHPLLGEQMLAGVDFAWDVPCMVRSHHERWDGGGYPDALAGGAIPLPARILCLADVFDALTTTRSYHPARSTTEALHIMQQDTGAFDPALFACFRALAPALIAEEIPAPL